MGAPQQSPQLLPPKTTFEKKKMEKIMRTETAWGVAGGRAQPRERGSLWPCNPTAGDPLRGP